MSDEAVELLRKLYEPWARGDFSATGYAFDPDGERPPP
jgi:hypothetical protein